MIVAYLKNRNNGMLYKAVDNRLLLMWSPVANKFIRCCTKYEDLFVGDYMNNFDLIKDSEINLK